MAGWGGIFPRIEAVSRQQATGMGVEGAVLKKFI